MRATAERPGTVFLALVACLAFAAPAVAQMTTGTYTGDGQSLRQITGLGFEPAVVIIKADRGEPAVIRTASMPSGQAKYLSENQSLRGGLMGVFSADGFEVSGADEVNRNNTRYDWIAFAAVAGRFAQDLYFGDGADGRSVEVGFRPDYLMVVPHTNEESLQRSSAMPEDYCLPFGDGSAQSGRIISFTDTGFLIGSDDQVNQNNQEYSFLAWRAESLYTSVGTYLGDDQDDRDIDEPGLVPNWVAVKGDSGEDGVHRTASLAFSPESLFFRSSSHGGDRLQDLHAGGFQVGGDKDVNEIDKDFYWVAFGRVHDLVLTLSADRDSVYAGEQVELTYILGNPGPDRLTGAIVDAALPTGLSYVSHTLTSGGYDPIGGEWKLTALDAGDMAQMTVTATVQAGGGSTLACTASISEFSDNDPDTLNNAALQPIHVLRYADLGLSGETTDPRPQVGDEVQLRVGVQNLGSDAATAVTVSDDLPAGLEYVSHTASVGSYDPIDGVWRINTLGVLSVALLQVNVRVLESAAGFTLTWSPVIESELYDPNPGNNSDDIELQVPAADLALGMTVDDATPQPGDRVTFTVTVDNDGPDPATSASIRDLLPAGLDYVSALPSQGSYDPVSGYWTVGALGVGGSATLDLTADVSADQPIVITNTAALRASSPIDPDGSNNQASADITLQRVEIRLEGGVDDDHPNVGQTITFHVTAENATTLDASGLVVRDRLPAGLNYVNALPSVGTYDPVSGLWNIGDLAAGASCVLQLVATVEAGTGGRTIYNSVSIASFDQMQEQQLQAVLLIPVTVRAADLRLLKNVDDPTPIQGEQVDFTVLVTNQGPDTAFAVVAADTLPAGLLFQGAVADQGSYSEVTGLWTLGTLAVGETATLVLTAEVQLDVGSGDSAVNVARITACDQEDPDTGNNQDDASLTQQSADLALDKVIDEAAPAAGDTVVFTLALRNDGPSASAGVAVLDTLPTGVTYAAHDPAGAAYDPGTGQWDVADLAAGESDSLRITAVVDADASGRALVNEALVTASDQADPDGTDNQDEAAFTVRAADLALALTADDLEPTVGDTVALHLELSNTGPDLLDEAEVEVVLPAGLELLAWDAGTGVFDDGLDLWSLAGLASGGLDTLTLQVRVQAGTVGTNQPVGAAVVASGPGDPEPADDVADLVLTIRGADLALGKTVNIDNPFVGETVLYTLTLRNEGPDDAAAVEVSDLLPDGLTYVSHTPSWEDYDPGTGLWTAGAVAVDQTQTLFLQAEVSEADPGETIVNSAAVVASDLADPDPGDDQDDVAVTIPAADLSVALGVDDPAPGQDDVVTFDVRVDNDGPDTATGVVLSLVLPADLSFVSSLPGGYDPASGRWVVGELEPAAWAELAVSARVEAGAIGDTLDVVAEVIEVDQDDPLTGDERAEVEIRVLPDADLAVSLSVDQSAANVGDAVAWTVRVDNLGPSAATGVAVRDTLPEGVAPGAWEATAGTYDPVAHLWTVGDLVSGEGAELTLHADVLAGTGGRDLAAGAEVAAADQPDREPGNDQASATVHVLGADLSLASYVDLDTPNEGDDVNFTFSVTNQGPDAATGVVVVDSLPTGLTYVSHTPPTESYVKGEDGAWLWDVGNVESQTPRVLFVRTRVEVGTTGQLLRHAAEVRPGLEEDPALEDNLAENLIAVEGVDLALGLQVDVIAPAEGDTLVYTLRATNHGPNPATGVAVLDSLGDGLTLLSVEPEQDFDTATGMWTVGDLAADSHRVLTITTRVDERTGGSILLHHACVQELDQVDPEPENDEVDLKVTVQVPGEGHVLAAVAPLADAPVVCLAAPTDVFALELVNWSVVPDTLLSLTLHNDTDGIGDVAQLDAAWASLIVWREDASGREPLLWRDDPFVDGLAELEDLRLVLAPEDTVRLVVGGVASGAARDGDGFVLGVRNATELVFNRAVMVDAEWPLSTGSSHPVDAFVADQAAAPRVDTDVLVPGGVDHLVMALDLTADGYAPHALNALSIVNEGTARPGHEIDAVRVWLDDGDGLFSALLDESLGDMAWTGDRWRLAGLGRTIPVGGVRLLITLDAAVSAEGSRSVKLAVPIDGVEVDGGADGPLDRALVYPFEQVISGSDRLWLSAATLPWRDVRPDGGETLLLHLTATNTFDVPRTLSRLRVTGDVVSAYTTDIETLEGVVAQVMLRDDDDLDGIYDGDGGAAALGAASLSGGAAVLDGLDWTVPPASTRHLFVTARLSGDGAADGDSVALAVSSAVDVQFDGQADLAGDWPLGSGGLVVDGLLAASVQGMPVPARTVGPGEGPVPALELVAPRNGHADDVLDRIVLVNLGNATSADIAEARLYRDGGDGAFDGGAVDDVDLGPLLPHDDLWSAEGLGAAIGAGGARLFVGVTGSPDLNDSTTVRLALPVDGLDYASDNDGPLDVAVDPGGTLLFSRAPLHATLEVEPDETTVGQTLTARMIVRNAGAETALAVIPSTLAAAGDGGLVLQTGPEPSVLDLAPGALDTFTWTYLADAVGTITLSGSASGQTGGGSPLASLPVGSGEIRVVAPAPSLLLSSLSQLPFAVNGGQTDVSALTLDLSHPGGAGSAAVRVDALALELGDGEGGQVPAGGLLTRLRLRADGALVYDLAVAPDASGPLVLTPEPDVVLAPGENRVFTLDLDIAADAAGAAFRLELPAGGLVAIDAVGGGTVPVDPVGGAYPVVSELTHVVEAAGTLMLGPGEPGAAEASRGQTGVVLGEITATNPGELALDADIQLGVIAVSLYDAAGEPVAAPASHVTGLGVWLEGEPLAWRELEPTAALPCILTLETPVTVEAGTSARLEVRGDLPADAPLGAFALAVDAVDPWDARDANSGVPVPVVAEPDPLIAPSFTVVLPAELVHLGGRPVGPPVLTQGAQGQPVLEIDLRHPAEPGTAPVAVDTLRLRCVDGQGAGLATGTFMSRITLLSDGVAVGATLANGNADGFVDVPLSGVSVAPSDVLTLEATVDLLAGAAVEAFQLQLDLEGVGAVDAYLGTGVDVTADAGVVVPLSSGPRAVHVASDELVVGVEDLMPPALSVLEAEIPVLRLELLNPAPPDAGDLVVDAITLHARDGGKGVTAMGALATELRAYHGDVLWGATGAIDRGDTTAVISAAHGFLLPPGRVDVLEIRLVLAAEPTQGSVAVGLDLDDVSARQPEGELVSVSVLPAAGQVFPFWTATGSVAESDLEGSYSNFPNPFAAGREATTFVFALVDDATVDLRLYTPRGERVRTLLDGVPLAAGLHQDVAWDGRNGNGDVVRNGVYIAEITVRSADGATTRLRRKVAVVR